MSIADKITRLQTAKTNIATAITNKGGTVSSGDGFEDFATDIGTIPSGATEPTKGFVPTEWDSNGYITKGKWFGDSIPSYYFSAYKNASTPATYKSVNGLTKLAHFVSSDSNFTNIGNYAFFKNTYLISASLPSSLTSISGSAFNGCTNLALTSLPSGLTSIGDYAFRGCTNLALTSLPNGLTSIGSTAFCNCTNLTSITFKGTPTSIANDSFSGCTNLTNIYVPWSEGEVANAPWDATNATIHYNQTV